MAGIANYGGDQCWQVLGRSQRARALAPRCVSVNPPGRTVSTEGDPRGVHSRVPTQQKWAPTSIEGDVHPERSLQHLVIASKRKFPKGPPELTVSDHVVLHARKRIPRGRQNSTGVSFRRHVECRNRGLEKGSVCDSVCIKLGNTQTSPVGSCHLEVGGGQWQHGKALGCRCQAVMFMLSPWVCSTCENVSGS